MHFILLTETDVGQQHRKQQCPRECVMLPWWHICLLAVTCSSTVLLFLVLNNRTKEKSLLHFHGNIFILFMLLAVSGTRKKAYLKAKIEELENNSKIKNIGDLYRGSVTLRSICTLPILLTVVTLLILFDATLPLQLKQDACRT